MVNFIRGCKIDVYVLVVMVILYYLVCCRLWKLYYWFNCRVIFILLLICVKLCVLRLFKYLVDVCFKGIYVYEKCGIYVFLIL